MDPGRVSALGIHALGPPVEGAGAGFLQEGVTRGCSESEGGEEGSVGAVSRDCNSAQITEISLSMSCRLLSLFSRGRYLALLPVSDLCSLSTLRLLVSILTSPGCLPAISLAWFCSFL